MDIANNAEALRISMYFWFQQVSPFIWIRVFLILSIYRNIGEIGFTFTAIKVGTVVGLIILGLVIVVGGWDHLLLD